MRSYTEAFERWCDARQAIPRAAVHSGRASYLNGVADALSWMIEDSERPPLILRRELPEQLTLIAR